MARSAADGNVAVAVRAQGIRVRRRCRMAHGRPGLSIVRRVRAVRKEHAMLFGPRLAGQTLESGVP
jgi:hypothetical protein